MTMTSGLTQTSHIEQDEDSRAYRGSHLNKALDIIIIIIITTTIILTSSSTSATQGNREQLSGIKSSCITKYPTLYTVKPN
jgi:hypothetical protein